MGSLLQARKRESGHDEKVYFVKKKTRTLKSLFPFHHPFEVELTGADSKEETSPVTRKEVLKAGEHIKTGKMPSSDGIVAAVTRSLH